MAETINRTKSWIQMRRLGAIVVDGLGLMFLGLFLGLFLDNYFIAMGTWGTLLGILISGAYFGIFDSACFRGQTLGKKLMKIQLQTVSQNYATPLRATMRFLILGVPYFLGAIFLRELGAGFWAQYTLLLIFWIFALALAYLFVFNRNTHQTVHDIVTGTCVVPVTVSDPVDSGVWRGHWMILFVLTIVFLGVSLFITSQFENAVLDKIVVLQEKIEAEPEIVYSRIRAGLDENSTSLAWVAVEIFVNEKVSDEASLKQRIDASVRQVFLQDGHDFNIQVVMHYGYDIGIASKKISRVL